MAKNEHKGNPFYCDYSNNIQLFYRIEITGNDENGDEIELSEEEKKQLLPDLLSAFQSSFMGKTYPLCDDQFPEGTKAGGHFISFDKDHGIVLCMGVYINSRILSDTEKTKEVLYKLEDEIDGQFNDGWGENGFLFESGDKPYYCKFSSSDLVGIVASVQGHCANFSVRWKNTEAIEHINWMLYHDNGAFDMLYRPEESKAEIQAQLDMLKKFGIPPEKDYTMQRFNYIKEHLDMFFET